MEQFLQVGIISSTHGVRGEVKVYPTTDDVRRFTKCKSLLVDDGTRKRELEVEGVKFFKQFAILKFKGFDTIEAVSVYKGKSLYVERKDAVRLKEDEYYIADLIGMTVTDESDNEVGTLKEVLETGANDVYVIERAGGGELLLPAIKECILLVEPEEARMKVRLLEGL